MENNSLVPIGDIERMGMAIAKSGLFGMRTPEQAIALMLIANAEGLHPAIAARDYDVIQGRPALKAKAKLARFQRAGGKVKWHCSTDTKCAAEFSHPSSPSPLLIEWDMQRAATAGLANKSNWKAYPRQMLRARVISEGVDAVYPESGGLMYVPEEVQDFDDPPPQNAAPVETHAKVVEEEPAPEPAPEPVPPPPEPPAEPAQKPEDVKEYTINGAKYSFVFRGPCSACGIEKDDRGRRKRINTEDGRCYDCTRAGTAPRQDAGAEPQQTNDEPPPEAYDDDLPF